MCDLLLEMLQYKLELIKEDVTHKSTVVKLFDKIVLTSDDISKALNFTQDTLTRCMLITRNSDEQIQNLKKDNYNLLLTRLLQNHLPTNIVEHIILLYLDVEVTSLFSMQNL